MSNETEHDYLGDEVADAILSPPQSQPSQQQQMQNYRAKNAATAMMEISELKSRREAIQKVYESVMQEDIHYGMPFKDSNKPTLLKAGGEVLCATFMLSPKLSKTIRDLGDGHREIEFSCHLYHIPTGKFIGEGVGSCSTMESKYRYRYINEATGVGFGKAVWDAKDAGDYGRAKDLLRKELADAGKPAPADADVWMTKDGGQWQVSIKQKTENPDIANEYNTVLKIAKKRALNDAVLTATGASEYFTQDLEDIKANEGESYGSGKNQASNSPPKPPAQPKAGKTTTAQPPPEQSMPQPQPQPMTDSQRQQIIKLAMELPDDRRKKLMTYIDQNASKISMAKAKKMYLYLKSFNKLKKHFEDFEHDEGDLPIEYWNALHVSEDIDDLMFLNDKLGAAIEAIAEGDDDPYKVDELPPLDSDQPDE